MRTIKFRLWDKDFNEYSAYHLNRLLVIDINDTNRFIAEQFTGLCDKNGKEIYEGDILDLGQTVNGCNLFTVEWSNERLGWTVRYTSIMNNPRTYEYDITSFFKIDVNTGEGVEVIGNIHENKELLK